MALLAACKRRGIPVLCVAGAGAKADPTRLRIADMCECSVDPLARSVRSAFKGQASAIAAPGQFPVMWELRCTVAF